MNDRKRYLVINVLVPKDEQYKIKVLKTSRYSARSAIRDTLKKFRFEVVREGLFFNYEEHNYKSLYRAIGVI